MPDEVEGIDRLTFAVFKEFEILDGEIVNDFASGKNPDGDFDVDGYGLVLNILRRRECGNKAQAR